MLAGFLSGCGGLRGQPPDRPPVVKSPGGQSYYLVARGPYQAFYDAYGKLDRIEYDSNGDGKPDQIARHEGRRHPRRLEIDTDFDGRFDRWEDYDDDGRLLRHALVAKDGRAHRWTVVDAKGEPLRYEYDDKGTGHTDRVEIIADGRVARVELDSDHDGRIDRWQDWTAGRLQSESIDLDADGKPDRRLVYDGSGHVLRIERLAP
jgi:hypothetical protein